MSAACTSVGLEADGIRITYGGNVAVEQASLTAPIGAITGLIGPNGAGKTSIFNACNGLLRPAAGSVRFDGEDITRHSAARRARAGLGRTYQIMQLVTTMSVRDNVALGAAARHAGANPLRHMRLSSRDRRAVSAAVTEAMELCGISSISDAPVGGLSTGSRRLVELARVVAGGYRLLLLDEPSSGLDGGGDPEYRSHRPPDRRRA